MRGVNITILTILTITVALTATAEADTLNQDSTRAEDEDSVRVFTVSAQEWLDKVGIVNADRQAVPFEADSCVAGDHQLPIPFVQDELAGRPLAFFSLRDVVLDLGYERQEESPKDIQVVFDTLSRLVVYIRCTGEASRPENLYPWASIDTAEQQIASLGERYTSIPDATPSLNALAALGRCKHYSAASQDLIMYYVMYTGWSVANTPAWVINMRGLPPGQTHLGPHYSMTYRRVVLNAMSGAELMVVNSPAPVLEPDSLDPLRW